MKSPFLHHCQTNFDPSKISRIFLKKQLTNQRKRVKILSVAGTAGVAQLVEQLICNQQVGGSNPSTSSKKVHMGEFQSGQMGQTVNLLSLTSVVRIHLPPPKTRMRKRSGFYFLPFTYSLLPHLYEGGAAFCSRPSLFSVAKQKCR